MIPENIQTIYHGQHGGGGGVGCFLGWNFEGDGQREGE